ncbi:hypothetical protein PYV50_24005 [Pseudomonas sp. H22_DOA]|nr:hypothetical protein PYV50_24005 [Pseudomonas sp. H22_DOA]
MATVMKKVDAVIVGFGWTGAIMAKELTEAGLNVLALERGPMQDTYPDGNYPQVIDELTYSVRKNSFRTSPKRLSPFATASTTSPCRTASWARSCRAMASAVPGCTGRACTFASTRSSCACAATTRSATAKASFPRT